MFIGKGVLNREIFIGYLVYAYVYVFGFVYDMSYFDFT